VSHSTTAVKISSDSELCFEMFWHTALLSLLLECLHLVNEYTALYLHSEYY